MNRNRTFGGIPYEYSSIESSNIFLQPIPYDGTSTWGKGANKGFEAFMNAADNMELFDIETQSEVYKRGIHILPELTEYDSPESVFLSTYQHTQELLKKSKFLTFWGGEHSISIGVIKAFYEHYNDLTVLQLDAHADLRPNYNGSPYNHACAVHDASKNTNLIQVGIRSMDSSECQHMNYDKCYFDQAIQNDEIWMYKSIDQMTNDVYITLDLDVLDPSVMPSTGTPEPGGLTWYSITKYLKKVFESRNVVGFDIVELCPIKGLRSPEFLAAKLYYKMLSYKFEL
jgi:agmatinase